MVLWGDVGGGGKMMRGQEDSQSLGECGRFIKYLFLYEGGEYEIMLGGCKEGVSSDIQGQSYQAAHRRE
jgi:hypothetical protein